MTTRKTLTALTTLAVVFGYGGAAQADPYADGWVSFNPVSPGTNVDGSSLSTFSDGDTDGIDAIGAPDWGGSFSQATVLGFDAATEGGTLVLEFLNNVCQDGPGNDLKIYEAVGSTSSFGNESGTVQISNDGGQTFVDIGSVNPTDGYELDVAGALPDFDQVRLQATDSAGLNTAAGMDIDAIECLNSVDGGSAGGGTTPPVDPSVVTVNDSCDVATGPAGIDVREIVASSDGLAVYLDISLCGEANSRRAEYRIAFDYADQTNLDGDNTNDGPDTFDGNVDCLATEDDMATYQGGSSSGPGWFMLDGNSISYEVNYTDLLAGSGVQAGDTLVMWVQAQEKGKVDHVPNAENGDKCTSPQFSSEAIVLELQPIP